MTKIAECKYSKDSRKRSMIDQGKIVASHLRKGVRILSFYDDLQDLA